MTTLTKVLLAIAIISVFSGLFAMSLKAQNVAMEEDILKTEALPAEVKTEKPVVLMVDKEILTAADYKSKRMEIAVKVKNGEPVDYNKLRDFLEIEKSKCGGVIKINNYAGKMSDLLQTFLEKGCEITK